MLGIKLTCIYCHRNWLHPCFKNDHLNFIFFLISKCFQETSESASRLRIAKYTTVHRGVYKRTFTARTMPAGGTKRASVCPFWRRLTRMGPVKLVWLTSLTLSSIVFVFVIHLLFRTLLRFNENRFKIARNHNSKFIMLAPASEGKECIYYVFFH